MTSEEIKDAVRTTVAQVLQREASSLDGNAHLGLEIDLDSLDLTEIAVRLEALCDVRFGSDYPEFTSINDISKQITELRSKGPGTLAES